MNFSTIRCCLVLPAPMKKIFLTIFKYVVAFGIGILLMWWSFKGLTKEDLHFITSVLKRANYLMLIPVFIILMLSHLFRALRWKQLIEPLGYKPPVFQLLCGVLIGYIANQFIPRAGEIVRCTSISKYNRIPAEKLIGTIVAERAFDMVSLLVITTFTVVIQYDIMQPYVAEIGSALTAKFQHNSSFRLLIFGLLITIALILYFFLKKFKTHKYVQLLKRIVKGILQGLLSIKNVSNKPMFLVNTVLLWTCYVMATWLGCFALEETMNLSISAGLAMLVLGTFGVIVAPGGLGAYPIAIQKTLLLYNIPENIGFASGWLLWIAQFVFVVFFGIIAYVALKLKYRKHESHTSNS